MPATAARCEPGATSRPSSPRPNSLYLVTRSLDPTWPRNAARWKPALNAFAITFERRILPSQGN